MVTNVVKASDMGTLKPFVRTAFFWLLACTLFFLNFFSNQRGLALSWFLGIWLLSVLDLYALYRIGNVLLLRASVKQTRPEIFFIQSTFWGLVKVACLGLFGVVLMNATSAPSLALLLGLGTVVVVPLMGGYWWSKKEMNYA